MYLNRILVPIVLALALLLILRQAGAFETNPDSIPITPATPSTTTPTSLVPIAINKVKPAMVKIDTSSGFGTGVVVDKAGYILTANHVVANAQNVRINFIDNNNHEFTIIARDTIRDLAILKISSNNVDFPVAVMGDSDKLLIGEDVLILQHLVFGKENASRSFCVFSGIVTGVVAENGIHYIKTNAAINHSNSGEPIVDLDGKIVGIMVAKAFKESDRIDATVVEGISYAVSINDAKTFIAQNVGK